MKDIVVRKAALEDLATLNRFQQGIVDAERGFDSTIKDGAVQYYDIAGMLTCDDIHFVVAEVGTRLVGCGYARIEAAKHYLKHSVHAYQSGSHRGAQRLVSFERRRRNAPAGLPRQRGGHQGL